MVVILILLMMAFLFNIVFDNIFDIINVKNIPNIITIITASVDNIDDKNPFPAEYAPAINIVAIDIKMGIFHYMVQNYLLELLLIFLLVNLLFYILLHRKHYSQIPCT